MGTAQYDIFDFSGSQNKKSLESGHKSESSGLLQESGPAALQSIGKKLIRSLWKDSYPDLRRTRFENRRILKSLSKNH